MIHQHQQWMMKYQKQQLVMKHMQQGKERGNGIEWKDAGGRAMEAS